MFSVKGHSMSVGGGDPVLTMYSMGLSRSNFSFCLGSLGGLGVTVIGSAASGSPGVVSILSSADGGQTWSATTMGYSKEVRGSTAFGVGNGRMVVALGSSGSSSEILWTDDGSSLYLASNALPVNFWYGMDFGNGYFRAGAYALTSHQKSTNGTSFSEVSTNNTITGHDHLTYGNGIWIASNRNAGNFCAKSVDDGATWTKPAAPIQPSRIRFNGGYFWLRSFSVSTWTTQYYSADGVTWNSTTMPVAAAWWHPVWNATKGYWLCQGTSGATQYLAVSTDLASWSLITPLPAEFKGGCTPVVVNGNFVGVSIPSDNTAAYSWILS